MKHERIRWVLANALGIGAFLAFASNAWIEPELADEPGASGGDFVVWGLSGLPILAIFIIAHLIVGGMVLTKMRRDWAGALALTASCWIAAAILDNAHHGI